MATELDITAALEEVAPGCINACGRTPTIMSHCGSAGNDGSYECPAICSDSAEAWAGRALGANGFGDAATADAASFAPPTSYEPWRAARAHRSLVLGGIVVAAVKAAVALVREVYLRYRQRRQVAAIHDALNQLDEHTLRDLGFDYSETRSIAAEMTGEAAYTRARTLWSSTYPR